MQMNALKAVLMVNMTVVLMVVHMVSASMAAGHVTAWMIAMTAQMKPTVVVLTVPMVNLTVAMDLASMAAGHVTVMVTVPMAQMKPTVVAVLLQSAKIVNMISLLTDLNAVIPQQMHLA
jgi:hypothetical protein